MQDRLFLIALLGFTLGILFRSFVNFGFSFALFLAVLAGALWLVGFLEKAGRASPAPPLIPSLALFIFLASLGIFRYDLSELNKNNPALDRNLNQRAEIVGTVSDEPDERENSARLIISAESVTQNGKPIAVKNKILVTADLYPKFQYGDRLLISGLLSKPKNFADAGGKIFDYQGYLAKEGIYYQISRPKVTLMGSGHGNFVVAKLFALKHAFLKNIGNLIPEPHASLLGGLVVGAKRSLGKNLLEDFRHAGVIHVVVLSGYNITIVAEAIMNFFGFLPSNAGRIFGALGIILFAIMTGGSATVVRASIMALLVILAKAVSRRYDIIRALLFAGFLMALQNPKILVFDSSFQLSFMSTLALIFVSPLLEKHFSFITEKFGLRSVVVATLSTQIFVLPMLLYKMGELSLVALPVNLLILFAIPSTMFFGFLAGVVGFISGALAFPWAFMATALLSYELWLVEFFSHLPFSFVAVNSFPLWLALLCYLFYLVIYLRFRPRPARHSVDKENISALLGRG